MIKPNIAWDRTPEQAANTNPEVVAEVVRQCWQAGAKRVIVTDVSCNEPRRCFQRSGIQAAARAEGAEVILPDPELFREVDLGGVVLKSWPVFTPFLEADKIINLPIAKHHVLTGATLGMKNWYGILGGQRNRLHQQIHQSLVDLASFMLPTLTMMDCYRILLRNGPTGGNLEDVALKKTMVAGTDPVALDAYVAKAYWNLDPEQLPYLQMAATRGLGTVDFDTLAGEGQSNRVERAAVGATAKAQTAPILFNAPQFVFELARWRGHLRCAISKALDHPEGAIPMTQSRRTFLKTGAALGASALLHSGERTRNCRRTRRQSTRN